MEHKPKCKSCLLQGPQLPSMGCSGSLLASGSADCTVKLWDVTTSSKAPKTEENKGGNANRLRSLKTLPTKSTPVYALRFSQRNLLFAAGGLSKSTCSVLAYMLLNLPQQQ
ncbi:transcription initiation factor TFIID subunit 5-like isoform X2 [Alnus glutinosa]|uniref:transcription initiation factor TFIID subunit 5-like isoform X2 n=1 Tax=Alnus glutinosa TaxID=3517 RepID=UPI002D770776|nr:transcription initiation factor TFIID subunit 5-like isoform X2 [Alnus glutinosa]